MKKLGILKQKDLSGSLYLFYVIIDGLYLKTSFKDWFHSYFSDVIVEKHSMEDAYQFLYGCVENGHSLLKHSNYVSPHLKLSSSKVIL